MKQQNRETIMQCLVNAVDLAIVDEPELIYSDIQREVVMVCAAYLYDFSLKIGRNIDTARILLDMIDELTDALDETSTLSADVVWFVSRYETAIQAYRGVIARMMGQVGNADENTASAISVLLELAEESVKTIQRRLGDAHWNENKE